jgi:hypothetical protein
MKIIKFICPKEAACKHSLIRELCHVKRDYTRDLSLPEIEVTTKLAEVEPSSFQLHWQISESMRQ